MNTASLRHLLLATAIYLMAGSAAAQPAAAENDTPELAIKGYSPVSYFEKGLAEKGSPEFTSAYRGKTYRFSSAGQKQKFDADPASYAPLFPDHCPYNLSLGRKVAIDPTNFKIVGGKLLLFHRTDEMNALEAWERQAEQNNISEEEMLRRARSNLIELQY